MTLVVNRSQTHTKTTGLAWLILKAPHLFARAFHGMHVYKIPLCTRSCVERAQSNGPLPRSYPDTQASSVTNFAPDPRRSVHGNTNERCEEVV